MKKPFLQKERISDFLDHNPINCETIRCFLVITGILILFTQLPSQHLDIQGHSRIRGNLDIVNMIDTTSIYIGPNVGLTITMDSLLYKRNTFIGSNTGLYNSDGFFNSFFGSHAGTNNSLGSENCFFGASTGKDNSLGSENCFFGVFAGVFNTIGNKNAFFGNEAGKNNESGNHNSFFGVRAGALNKSVSGNSFFGAFAGSSNISGLENSFFGANSGSINQGDQNTYIGYAAGRYISDTNSVNNTFVGHNAGLASPAFDEFGHSNTFVGQNSGSNNQNASENTFIGQDAGSANVNGSKNTYIGQGAGKKNTSGQHNTFVGERSGDSNIQGEKNTFVGQNSGGSNATGDHNTFIGKDAGRRNRFGSKNTCLGDSSNLSSAILNNAVALGYKAIVDADHKVRIGNDSITVIEGQVPFSPSSDIRLKEDIHPIKLGLEFINQLNPVSYHRKANPQDNLEMGLIAQQLQSLLKKHNMKNSGMVHQVGDSYMSVRYNDLFAPLIKAVQELSIENDALKLTNEQMQKVLEDQEQRLKKLE